MTPFDTLLHLEQSGADTIEISTVLNGKTLTGVANSTESGTVQCFFGADDDCEVSPAEFNKRFCITEAIYE